jgi:hypothetical protein
MPLAGPVAARAVGMVACVYWSGESCSVCGRSSTLSLVDVVALVPLLAGTGLLLGGLWQRRHGLDAALSRRPWSARVGVFVAGLGLGLLVALVFAFFWWWAIGAALLTATLLAAALVAAGSEGTEARSQSGRVAVSAEDGRRKRPPVGRP